MTATEGMPKYKCHKEVHALKILKVQRVTDPDTLTDSPVLVFEGAMHAPVAVTETWVAQHEAEAGGYYVVYEDGYTSFSPAEAFEKGYTLYGFDTADTPFVRARVTMRHAFETDMEPGGLHYAYQSSVAMLLSDQFGIKDHDERNKAAAAVLKMIFDLDLG